MIENICPVCHHQNREENRYCTQCGSKLFNEENNGVYLVVMNGESLGKKFKLKRSSNTIGRENDNLIYIDDNQVSKKHAEVLYENEEYWIKDSGSRNGVYLNGKKIEQAERLFNGNILKVGSKILKFEIDKSN